MQNVAQNPSGRPSCLRVDWSDIENLRTQIEETRRFAVKAIAAATRIDGMRIGGECTPGQREYEDFSAAVALTLGGLDAATSYVEEVTRRKATPVELAPSAVDIASATNDTARARRHAETFLSVARLLEELSPNDMEDTYRDAQRVFWEFTITCSDIDETRKDGDHDNAVLFARLGDLADELHGAVLALAAGGPGRGNAVTRAELERAERAHAAIQAAVAAQLAASSVLDQAAEE